MRWLITGGCGFIGTSLIRRLVDEGGHQVRIIDNLSVGTRDDLSLVTEFSEPEPDRCRFRENVVELVVGDILDEQLAMTVTESADVIVHLAANTGVGPSVENPRGDCNTNVLGTLNYLEAARHNHVSRFVFASSGAPIGEVEPPIHEELAPHPVSPYGASKLAGEGYCSAYFRTFGVATVALRFGNVYGPGSGHKSSVVAKFIRRALRGEPLEIYGDGSQSRDFIFIDDLVNAIVLAATASDAGGEVYQIATNTETTVNDLAERICKTLDTYGVRCPSIVKSSPRSGDVKRNYSDIDKAWKRLSWSPVTSLNCGLDRTVKWFLERGRRDA